MKDYAKAVIEAIDGCRAAAREMPGLALDKVQGLVTEGQMDTYILIEQVSTKVKNEFIPGRRVIVFIEKEDG